MDLDNYSKEQLWQLVVEAAHASVMYTTRKAYIRDQVLPEQPDVTPQELTHRLNMPLGEAIVILNELTKTTTTPTATVTTVNDVDKQPMHQ